VFSLLTRFGLMWFSSDGVFARCGQIIVSEMMAS
jgi:hypothetical protein